MAGPKQLQNLEVSNRRLNSTNVPLEVALVDASGNQVVSFGGGTQYTEGDADATITGTALLFEIDSTANTVGVPSSTRGLPVNIVAGSAAGTEYTDANSTISGPNQTFRDSSGAVRGVASTRGFPVAIVAGSAAGTEYTDANSTISGPNQTFRDSSGAVRGVASTRGFPVAIVAGSAAGTEYTDADSTISGANLTFRDSSGAVRGVASTRALPVAGVVRSTNSVIGDLLASVQQNSTTWNVQVGALVASTSLQASSAAGAHVRLVPQHRETGDVTLGALNDAVTIETTGFPSVGGILYAGDFDGVITVETSLDNGASWDAGQGSRGDTGGQFFSITLTNPSQRLQITTIYTGAGTTHVRLRVSTYNSGSLVARLRAANNVDLIGTNLTGMVSGVAVPSRRTVIAGVDAGGLTRSPVVMNTEPSGSEYGLVTRLVGNSTVVVSGAVRSTNSVAADFLATVSGTVRSTNSVAGDFVSNVSSVAGIVAVRPSDTNFLSSAGAHFDSSGALVVAQGSTAWTVSAVSTVQGRVLVAQNSTVWETQSKIQDSSGVTVNIVGTRPSSGAQGFAVRTVLNDIQSTYISTMGNNSTSSTFASSVASQRIKVFAYSITSTMNGGSANTLSFNSSAANPIWGGVFRAISSGVTGIQQAVSPPAWLFATEAGSPLVFKITGATGTYQVNASWFVEA